MDRPRPRELAARFLLAAILTAPLPASAQSAPVPGSPFEDALAERLLTSALDARRAIHQGLDSYEARMVQRIRIGVGVSRRLPIRDRTLYHREEVARVRWSATDEHVVRWIGRREGSPSGGLGIDGSPFGIDLDWGEILPVEDLRVSPLFDPTGDRLDFFDAGFIMPASDEGLRAYRFRSGDTLDIRLPPPNRSLKLIEVIVDPLEEDWSTVEGSLWFDADTGVLTRATFRPSGVWDQEVQEPGDLSDVPSIIKPGIGTVHNIVLDYSLHEQEWWLPRRLLAEGTYEWGHGIVRMPLTIEWTMTEYAVNEAPSEEVSPQAGRMPSRGVTPDSAFRVRRSRTEFSNSGERDRAWVVEPLGVDLSESPELPEPIGPAPSLNFSSDELAPLLGRLNEVAGEEAPPPQPGLRRTLLSEVRYNRVQGLSLGWSRAWPLGSWGRGEGHLRIGTADVEPTVRGRLERGRLGFEAYRWLEEVDGRGRSLGIGNSVNTLLFGQDDGLYYRSTGAALSARFGDAGLSTRISLAGERHESVEKETDLSLATLTGGSLRANPDAADVDLLRALWSVSGQRGSDPQAGVLVWGATGEAGFGDAEYQRIALGFDVLGPLGIAVFGHGLVGGMELAAGVASRGTPPQRLFAVGGTTSLRGFLGGAQRGTGFWAVRGEIGGDVPMIRGLVFADVAWAGDRADFDASQPGVGVGVGVSGLDGLLRLEIAKGVIRGGGWRLHVRTEGIF